MSTTTPIPPTAALPEAAADYAKAVAAALSDLPDGEREDLVEEVEAHLGDVTAELGADVDDAGLRVRLGAPEAYAAELRAAAGYDPADAPSGQRGGLRLRTRSFARRSGERLMRLPAAERVRRLALELRPGWWVARAWVLLSWLSIGNPLHRVSLIPAVIDNGLANVALLVVTISASVWLGRRVTTVPPPRGWRRAAYGLSTLLALLCLPVAHEAQSRSYDGPGGDLKAAPAATASPLGAGAASNIFAFTPDGKPIPRFYLYDENGQPIDIGQQDACPAPPSPGLPFDNAYPRQQYTQRVDSNGNVIADCIPAGTSPAFGVTIPASSPSPSSLPSPSAAATTSASGAQPGS